MHTKIITLLSLALIVALASFGVNPAAAADTQPSPLPAGGRGDAPDAGTEFLSFRRWHFCPCLRIIPLKPIRSHAQGYWRACKVPGAGLSAEWILYR